ncbi:hypothetical protein SS05631_c18240 [Sinorhizobium sp. CCBAU 05631]|nr:hypothetical protein SS05631_c18240 [Sinorhizobium sp. CCBAU 05631]
MPTDFRAQRHDIKPMAARLPDDQCLKTVRSPHALSNRT